MANNPDYEEYLLPVIETMNSTNVDLSWIRDKLDLLKQLETEINPNNQLKQLCAYLLNGLNTIFNLNSILKNEIYDNDKYELFKQQLEGKSVLSGDLQKEYENIIFNLKSEYEKLKNECPEDEIIY